MKATAFISREYEYNQISFIVFSIDQVDMKNGMCVQIKSYMDQIIELVITMQLSDHKR